MHQMIESSYSIFFTLALLVSAVVWIWMLIDCARKEKSASARVIWLILIFISFIFGAFAYLLFRKLPRNAETIQGKFKINSAALDASVLMLVLLLVLPPVANQYRIFQQSENGLAPVHGGDEVVISSSVFGAGGQLVGWIWAIELGCWIPLAAATFLIARGRKFNGEVVLPWIIGVIVLSLFLPVQRTAPGANGAQLETFIAIARIGRGEIPLLTHWVWVTAILIGVSCGFARGGKSTDVTEITNGN